MGHSPDLGRVGHRQQGSHRLRSCQCAHRRPRCQAAGCCGSSTLPGGRNFWSAMAEQKVSNRTWAITSSTAFGGLRHLPHWKRTAPPTTPFRFPRRGKHRSTIAP
jgi:hypothetical protein